MDPISSKVAWGKALGGISYPLVSDFWPHGQVASAYGIFNSELGRAERATFIVDKSGRVRWAKIYVPGTLPDNSEILDALKQIENE